MASSFERVGGRAHPEGGMASDLDHLVAKLFPVISLYVLGALTPSTSMACNDETKSAQRK